MEICFYCKKEIPFEEKYTIYNGETACLDCVREKLKGKGVTTHPPTHYTPHHDLCNELAELLDKKRADYGNNLERFGVKGIIVRLNDKMERLINLVWEQGKDPQNESVIDTFMDISGYGLLAILELRKGER